MTNKMIRKAVRAGTDCRVDLNQVTDSLWHKAPGYQQRSHRLARVFDLLVASIALVVALPVMLLAALVESRGRGPVFYFQIRVGCDGHIFSVIKFRSMRTDAEQNGAQWASQNDPRVTSVGAFLRTTRIDELPQFINVLMGDMSVVGPRPERPEFVSELSQSIPHYDTRHMVKPGITGWAQVHYPYGASAEDSRNKLEYNLFYLQHRNLLLDMLVALKTVRVCLVGAGAR
jgi:lipopolysaccharide/colanic/teichoic acid biosynthesis glycosyltransferase